MPGTQDGPKGRRLRRSPETRSLSSTSSRAPLRQANNEGIRFRSSVSFAGSLDNGRPPLTDQLVTSRLRQICVGVAGSAPMRSLTVVSLSNAMNTCAPADGSWLYEDSESSNL
jgi:hypothetical protein